MKLMTDDRRPRRRRGGYRNRHRRTANKEPVPIDPEALAMEAEHRSELEIPQALISQDALRVVESLEHAGHLAYVVGGCVRDLALGRSPKDFDVATSARPEQVRRLFRNARIIGRRFRLVHVRFGQDRLIEVATFRRSPDPDVEGDLLVAADNVFGDPKEDALRRDFTVNGLFYTPRDGGRVIDYVGGCKDLEAKLLRSIGDADVRCQEDPVRMIRAIRFAAKHRLKLSPDLRKAINKHSETIHRCAGARLWEELLKVLRSGASKQAFALAQRTGFLTAFLPDYAAVYGERKSACERPLAGLDRIVKERGAPPSDHVLVSALILPMLQAQRPRAQAEKILSQWNEVFRIPNRLREQVVFSLLAVRGMVPEGPWVDPDSFSRRALFAPAVEVLQVLVAGQGEGQGLLKYWDHRRQPHPDEEDEAE